MTPRQLRYFLEVAQAGSITAAAHALHIAQPALSQHIAAMEDELGVQLLQRAARGVKLTAEGRRLLDRAASILRQLDRLKDDVHAASSEPAGPVSLCLVGSVAPILAVPLFRALDARAPGIRLHLATGMSSEARAMLEARRVEMALLPTAFELSEFEALPVFEERFCLFGRKQLFAGEAQGPMAFRDIGERPLIAPDREHDLRKLIERAALDQKCPLNVRYELNSSVLLRRAVIEGLGFAVMPGNTFCAADARGLVAREIVEPVIERTQSLAWLSEQPLTPAAEVVKATLVDVVTTLVKQGALKARLLV